MKDMYRSEKTNAADRMSINNISDFDFLRAVMSEGVEEARGVFHEMKKIADSVKPQQVSHHLGGKMIPCYNTLLALDDMNIRGQQIVYAAQYCDGDYQKLVELAQERDEGLIAYINKKQAETGRLGADVAVEGGASSTQSFLFGGVSPYHMTYVDMEDFASSGIEKQKRDYHSMDIYSGVSTEDAIEIAKTWGFEVAARYPVEDPLMRIEKKYEFLLMYNEKTGDFLEAPHASPGDVCFGGCRVVAARPAGAVARAFLSGMEGVRGNRERFSSGGKDFKYVEAHYSHGGVFHEYAKIGDTGVNTGIGWKDVPVYGLVSLPVLEPEKGYESLLFMVEQKLPAALRKEYNSLMADSAYSISTAAKALLMPDAVNTRLSSKARECYVKWEEDPFVSLFENSYATNSSVGQYSAVMRLAFALTGKENYAECEDAYKEYIREYLKSHQHRAGEFSDIDEADFEPSENDRKVAALLLGEKTVEEDLEAGEALEER